MGRKIIIVGSGVVSIPPNYGGATERIIFEISRNLSKKFDMIVLDRKESHNKSKEIIGKALYIRYGTPKFGNIFLMRAAEFIFGLRALGKIRKIRDTGLVHTHTVFTAMPIAFFRFLLPHAKLLYTCHNPAWTDPYPDFPNRFIKKIELYVMKKSDAVTTVSESMRRNIISSGISEQKIFAVHNFVDPKRFSPSIGKNWKDRRSIHGPMILFVGKLSRNKGIEYLLKAARIVQEKHPDVLFAFAGPVSFEYISKNTWIDMTEKLDLRNVLFLGAVKEQELPQVYAAADIFCFPTLKESFGMVVAEAMASGLPVIATDLEVLREVAGTSALFVERRNEKYLAKALITLIENKRLRRSLAKKSLERAKSFYTEKIMAEYGKIYRAIL